MALKSHTNFPHKVSTSELPMRCPGAQTWDSIDDIIGTPIPI
jgi:hypothetical protein